jgi:hypothetical protein
VQELNIVDSVKCATCNRNPTILIVVGVICCYSRFTQFVNTNYNNRVQQNRSVTGVANVDSNNTNRLNKNPLSRKLLDKLNPFQLDGLLRFDRNFDVRDAQT